VSSAVEHTRKGPSRVVVVPRAAPLLTAACCIRMCARHVTRSYRSVVIIAVCVCVSSLQTGSNGVAKMLDAGCGELAISAARSIVKDSEASEASAVLASTALELCATLATETAAHSPESVEAIKRFMAKLLSGGGKQLIAQALARFCGTSASATPSAGATARGVVSAGAGAGAGVTVTAGAGASASSASAGTTASPQVLRACASLSMPMAIAVLERSAGGDAAVRAEASRDVVGMTAKIVAVAASSKAYTASVECMEATLAFMNTMCTPSARVSEELAAEVREKVLESNVKSLIVSALTSSSASEAVLQAGRTAVSIFGDVNQSESGVSGVSGVSLFVCICVCLMALQCCMIATPRSTRALVRLILVCDACGRDACACARVVRVQRCLATASQGSATSFSSARRR
jgi:hypothetical protein